MTIFVRISPGLIALVAVALIAGHTGGVSVAIAALGIGVAVALVAAVAGGLLLIGHRLRQENPSPKGLVRVIRVSPGPRELPGQPRAIGGTVRLPEDQLQELAEILRRGQRPEQ